MSIVTASTIYKEVMEEVESVAPKYQEFVAKHVRDAFLKEGWKGIGMGITLTEYFITNNIEGYDVRDFFYHMNKMGFSVAIVRERVRIQLIIPPGEE